MMRTVGTLSLLLLLTIVGLAQVEFGDVGLSEEERRAQVAVRMFGGSMFHAGRDSKGPITAISLRPFKKRLAKKDLEFLARFPHLQRLEITAGGDVSLSQEALKSLEQLDHFRELSFNSLKNVEESMLQIARLKHLRTLQISNTKLSNNGRSNLAHLKPLENLQSLDLSAVQIGDDSLAHIAKLNQLRKLSFSGTAISDKQLEFLATLYNLEELDLSCTKVAGGGFAQLGKLTKLKTLSLQYAPITNDEFEPAKNLRSLQNIDLSGTQLGDAGMAHLGGLTDLRSLDLGDCEITGDGLAHLRDLKRMEVLSLRFTKVTDRGLENLNGMKQLRSLTLTGLSVTEKGIKLLQNISGLQKLDLINMQIDDRCVKWLREMNDMRSLDFTFSPITDESLNHIKGLKKLESLELRGTKVSDKGLELLTGHLPNLKWIGFQGTKVTPLGGAKFRKARPRVRVEHYDSEPIPESPADLKEVDLERYGLNPVMPWKDSKTGFIVGGKNPTSLIERLTHLNFRRIADLEKDMRPNSQGAYGVTSKAGFLGSEEKLLEIMAEDNRYVVDELGLTHQDLAKPMKMTSVLVGSRERHRFSYNGTRFEVRIVRFRGYQFSPFYDGTKTDSDVIVKNLDNGRKLKYSLLVPEMIERYGFYEGKGTPYRVEPRDVVAVFDYLKGDSGKIGFSSIGWWVGGIVLVSFVVFVLCQHRLFWRRTREQA